MSAIVPDFIAHLPQGELPRKLLKWKINDQGIVRKTVAKNSGIQISVHTSTVLFLIRQGNTGKVLKYTVRLNPLSGH